MTSLRSAFLTCLLLVLGLVLHTSAAAPTKGPSQSIVDAALAGSAHAATQLIEYYKDDERALSYWRQIAAENGDPIQQYNLWFDLSQRPDALSQKRAVFWLRRSAAAGDKVAAERLAEITAAKR
jgi:TPR repeat protein